MTDFLKAADDARTLLRGFDAVKTLADAFEQAGSIQQAQAEAQAALDALTPKVEAAAAVVAQTEANMRAAELEAKQIVADAKAQAVDLVNAARRNIEQSEAELALKKTAAELGCADMVNAAQAKFDALVEQRDNVAKEVEALEARVAEAKAFLAKLAA